MGPITEQTILITGATDGLGRYLAIEVGRAGARVIVHGRNPARAEQAREQIRQETGQDRVDVMLADLADLRQVGALAADIRERHERLDVLVNNAGIGFGSPRAGRELSADGIELRFAVNYLAGYHLTRELLPLLETSQPARIINVASLGQRAIDFSDPMLERWYDGRAAYAQSKLAQIMFTIDLAEELLDRSITVNALHPATFMNTTMVNQAGISPWSTVEDGGAATLRLMIDPAMRSVTGRFFDGRRERRADPQAYDPHARAQLRELTNRLIAAAAVPRTG